MDSDKAITAAGALAELTATFYKVLIDHDVPHHVAVQLTATFIQTTGKQ